MTKKPTIPAFHKKKLPSTSSSGLGEKWQKSMDPLQQRWQALTTRDQWALILLALFLLALGGGYGGYEVNRAAKAQQDAYQEAVSDYFWLRGQAGNINGNLSAEDASQSLDVKVTQMLSQSGISNAQVLGVGDGVQMSFAHDNQAVVSNALDALVKQGLKLTKLNIQQNPADKSILVQATVSR